MCFFLGIDLGTSYFKVGVFDEAGRLKGLGRCSVDKENDSFGTCELSIPVFWNTLYRCVGLALREANIKPEEIRALSYSSQTNSFILLDRSDKPLTPLILWPDQRVNERPEVLQTLINEPDYLLNTGQGVFPGIQSMIAKVNWYQTIEPQIWKKVKSIMSISDYLTFSLTGQRVSDYSTSSMTGLFNVQECKWWNPALEMLNIQRDLLSHPEKSGSLVGKLSVKGAERIGLSTNTDFFLGTLDHHMVAIGAGLQSHDYMSESTGTVLACVNYKQGYNPKKGVNLAPGLKDGYYFQMTFDENGATCLEWFQKRYTPDLSIPQLLELAEKIPVGSNELIAKPNSSCYEDMKGFLNKTGSFSPPNYVRAILESTSLSLLELSERIDEANSINAIIPSGGGAQSELWIQIKADMLDKAFFIPECNELACLGAAMVGYVGTSNALGWEETINKWVQFKKVIKPNPVHVEEYKDWVNYVKKI